MKVGRNQPCPCGSGRKFKRCCTKETDALQKELFETESEFFGQKQSDPVASAAHRLAAMIADRGNAALDKQSRDFLAGSPECLLVFLDGFLETANAAPGKEDEELADAYYFLLGAELNVLRVGLEHRYDWAEQLRRQLDHRLIDAVRGGEASVEQVIAIVNGMVEEQMQPGAEVLAVCDEIVQRQTDGTDPAALAAEIAAECDEDPFMIHDALYANLHVGGGAVNRDAIRALRGMPQAVMREGAALGVLNADS